jgi:hypothetical protein
MRREEAERNRAPRNPGPREAGGPRLPRCRKVARDGSDQRGLRRGRPAVVGGPALQICGSANGCRPATRPVSEDRIPHVLPEDRSASARSAATPEPGDPGDRGRRREERPCAGRRSPKTPHRASHRISPTTPGPAPPSPGRRRAPLWTGCPAADSTWPTRRSTGTRRPVTRTRSRSGASTGTTPSRSSRTRNWPASRPASRTCFGRWVLVTGTGCSPCWAAALSSTPRCWAR